MKKMNGSLVLLPEASSAGISEVEKAFLVLLKEQEDK